MKKKIILSYDYELFFGDKSGTVEKSLIIPTNRLLDCMESVGYRGNFFVDWQMLKYLKEMRTERTDADYNLIHNQLKDIVKRGHRIELHIHPHWVDAKYKGDGTWDFSDFRHYSLNSFSEDEVVQMFEEGTALLTSIAKEVDPDYKIVAFRAGGWAVQPFHVLNKAFQKTGITIESSVIRGAFADNEGSYYDFRNAPNSIKGYYHFENDVCKEVDNGQYIEVPISSVKLDYTYKTIRKIYSYFFGRTISLTDGTHLRTETSFISKAKRKSNSMPLTLSRVNPINVIINQWRSHAEISCYIDHPKDFTNLTEKSVLALSIIRKESILYSDILNNLK